MTPLLATGGASLLLSLSLVQENQTPAFRARVFTVPVHVTVLDSEGRPVRGLSSSDFRLFECGVPQQVRTFFEVHPTKMSVDATASRPGNEFFPTEPVVPTSPDPIRPGLADRTEPATEDEARFVVIFFDETLDPFLDSFSLKRAKVAADLFVDSINPEKDVVAVSWRNRVSEFTSNRERLHDLIETARPRTYGILGPADSERQSGLGLSVESFSRGPAEVADRYAEALGLDVPSPSGSGRAGTGQRLNDTLPLSIGRMVRENELLSRMFRADSYEGYLSLVSRMKGLKGRKIVLYFGKGVANPTGKEKSLDLYDSRLVARVFNDAGFSVYSINPQGVVAGTSSGLPLPEIATALTGSKLGREVLGESSSYAVENWTGNQYLNRWAIDTGGFGFFTNDIRKAVRRVLAETSFYYVLAYQPSAADYAGDYRKIEVKLSRPNLELRYRGGYFATEPSTLELRDRTVLTAFLAPGRFRAFPVLTEGRSTGESQLKVLVSFPFGAVEVAKSPEGRFLQKITVSFAAFDSADRIIGFEEALFQLNLSRSEWEELREGNATVERTIDIERKLGGPPKRLRTVVIVGQNRQIAAAVSDIQPAERVD